MNKVILIGNLGADPVLRHTASGRAVCNLNLATSTKWNDKETGEKKEKTEWHRLTVWGKTGEIASQYLSKGRQIAVEGRIEYSHTGEGDERKYFTDIVVDKLEFLGSKSGNGNGHSDEPPADPNAEDTPF